MSNELQIKHYMLPHDGVIPGQIFWCAYLEEDAAMTTLQGLANCTAPTARRHIPFKELIAWNFKSNIPKRIARPKRLEWLS